jgi:hypothetical protein
MTFDLLREFFGGADVGLGCDAVMLARHCRFTGSAEGGGDIETSAEIALFRHQLANAMYGFVVGHEVGHCYFQEQRETGLSLTAIEEETACDRYALAVSRVMANHDGTGLHSQALARTCFCAWWQFASRFWNQSGLSPKELTRHPWIAQKPFVPCPLRTPRGNSERQSGLA